jgi:hypothetical protein
MTVADTMPWTTHEWAKAAQDLSGADAILLTWMRKQ